MDGDTFGPYTAKQIQELQLMDDILVTEESMNEWLPAGRFDFNDMAKKELNELLSQRRTQNKDECCIFRSRYLKSLPLSN